VPVAEQVAAADATGWGLGMDEACWQGDEAWGAIGAWYALTEVRAGVLGLQERHGVSVTALLTVIWVGIRLRGQVADAVMRALVSDSERFQCEVLRPLRGARNRLKGWLPAGPERVSALRSRLLAAELDAERVEQLLVLERVRRGELLPMPEPAMAAADNALRYLRTHGVVIDVEVDALIARLVRVASDMSAR
jgi:uncharacterized protein (TIGR02444 family)